MRKTILDRRLLFTLVQLLICCWAWPVAGPLPSAAAAPLAPHACEDGAQASGALYRICMPTTWNNDLVVYAHGYVAPNRPVGIPEEQMKLPGTNLSVDQLATSQGLAFATSSYRTNGLIGPDAVADLVELVDIFKAAHGEPERIFLVGVSEGGFVTVLGVEQHPEVFTAGLALCGPYGSFRRQIDYFGDFRVLFDYFFPDLLPPDAVTVPDELFDQWETGFYTNTVEPALLDPANSEALDQLVASAGAAFAPDDESSKIATVQDLLWYNVMATNDATAKLAGQPFDNRNRRYAGSQDDETLNAAVERYEAEQVALQAIADGYETSGRLTVPLITMHTTGDPIVPYWQSQLYRGKTIAADNLALHEVITVEASGHCAFTPFQVLGAIDRLEDMADDPPDYQPATRVYLPAIGGQSE